MKYLNSEFVLAVVAGVIFSTPIAPYLGRLIEGYIASLTGRTAAVTKGIFLYGRVAAYIILFLVSTMWLAGATYQPFIYFRF